MTTLRIVWSEFNGRTDACATYDRFFEDTELVRTHLCEEHLNLGKKFKGGIS